jgi:hypothetical protein
VIASETDAAGNTGTATLTFTLDTTPPMIAGHGNVTLERKLPAAVAGLFKSIIIK